MKTIIRLNKGSRTGFPGGDIPCPIEERADEISALWPLHQGLRLLALTWLLACPCLVFAGTLDPRDIPDTEIDSTETQGYEIRFETRGNLWVPDLPADPTVLPFGFKEGISVGPIPSSKAVGELGGIEETIFGDYGARLTYGLRLGAGVKAAAGFNPEYGAVDVAYPMHVYITYPGWETLPPGDPITITTSFYPGRTAFLQSHFKPDGLPFNASLTYHTDLLAGIAGEVAVVGRLGFCLFPLTGIIDCDEGSSDEKPLFDLAQFFGNPSDFGLKQNIDLPEPLSGVVSGEVRVPNLTGPRMSLGSSDNPFALHSTARDENFIGMNFDISSAIVKGIIGIPLKDTLSILGAKASYNILDLGLKTGIHAVQDLSFTPIPKIRFVVRDAARPGMVLEQREILAGESITLATSVPDGFGGFDEIEIVPTIIFDHEFRNATSLRAGPSVGFLPLELGVDLPDEANELIDDLGPVTPLGGRRNLSFGLEIELASFENEFKLRDELVVPGTPYPITPNPFPPKLVDVCPDLPIATPCAKTIHTQSTDRLVYFLAGSLSFGGRLAHDGYATVNGVRVPTFETSPDGYPVFQIPGAMLQEAGILRVQLVNPGVDNPCPPLCDFRRDRFSNTIDLTVQENLADHLFFGPVETLQYPGFHQLDLSASAIGGVPSTGNFEGQQEDGFSAGAGLLLLSMDAESIESQLPQGSVLLWNGVPIPTEVILTDRYETADGLAAVYRITGAVPSSLQTRGGVQRVTFQTTGVNAPEFEVASQTPLTIDNPAPEVAEAFPIGASPEVELLVAGRGFTEDSVVLWDGAKQSTYYGSAGALHAQLAKDALVVGDHTVTVVNPEPGGGTSNAFVITTKGQIEQPFAGFSVAKLDIQSDRFEEQTTFELGSASDGIDPVGETTIFTAWTHTTTLPPGSWRTKRTRYPAEWVFAGVVDGVALDLKLTQTAERQYTFRAVGSGAYLTGQGHPVFVTLTVGDDSGTTEARADFLEP